ncbi:MAG: AsmA family protein [Deltaproteobacteria bacterium]|nr:AsmA family protein [Deltaproteobacteria bacterium]
MKKFIIIAVGLVVVVVVLLAGLAAVSPLFLNKYKEPILARVEKTIDRKVELGDIRLTLFTGIGVRLSDLIVGNVEGFRSEPMLTMKGLDLKVKLLPLLRKKVEVERVVLREPRIVIEKNEDGVFNFSDLVGGDRSAPQESKAPPASGTDSPSVLGALLVSRIRITGGRLAYYDAKIPVLQEGVKIENLNLNLENVSLDRAVSFSLSFGINRKKTDLQLSGTVGPVGRKIDLKSMPLSLQVAVHDFDLTRLMPYLGENPTVMIRKGTVEITGDLAGDPETGLNIKTEMRLNALTVQGPEKGETLVRDLNMQVRKEVLLELSRNRVLVKKNEINVGSATLRFTGEINHLKSNPELALKMESDGIPLAGWEKFFPALKGVGLDGLLRTDGTVSGHPSGKMQVVLNFSFPNLVVRLPKKEPAAVREEKVGTLFLPGTAAAAERPEKEAPQGPSSPSPLPENIDIKGVVEVAKGKIDNLTFSRLHANYGKVGNRIFLKNLSVRGFGGEGEIKGAAGIDFGKKPPAYRTNLQCSRVDLSVLQEVFPARKEKVGGLLSADLKVEGAGFGMKEIEKNLSGGGSFKIDQGALQNVNIEERVIKTVAEKLNLPVVSVARMTGVEITPGNRTPFEKLQGLFRIGGGKIDILNAILTSRDHGFSTTGVVGLNGKMDLAARMILRKVGKASGRKFTYYLVDEQNRKYIPFKVTGDVASPKVKVDLDALIRGQAKRAIRKEEKRLEDRLEKKLGPGGGKILKPLKRLFNF